MDVTVEEPAAEALRWLTGMAGQSPSLVGPGPLRRAGLGNQFELLGGNAGIALGALRSAASTWP